MGQRPIFCFSAMRKQSVELQQLLGPVVDGLGYELWGVEHSGSRGQGLLRIYIDAESGITVADCERVSRQVEAVLDVEEPVAGSYTLEVSSPGTDRPLFSREQLARYQGEQVSLRLNQKVNDRKKIQGRIESVHESSVMVCFENEVLEIELDSIDKANLVWQQ